MNSITKENGVSPAHVVTLTCAFIVAGFLFSLTPRSHAFSFDPGGGGTNFTPAYTPLDSWSFRDSTAWTSDLGYAPVSFTDLAYS